MLRKRINASDGENFDIGEKLISKFKERKELKFVDYITSETAKFKKLKYDYI